MAATVGAGMAFKRFIHGEMFTSEDFISLSMPARLLWVGLFGKVADDHGRGKAGAAYLKAEIFPADRCSTSKVTEWLREIAQAGMLHIYHTEGRDLFQIPSWATWQRPKYAKASKYPEIKDLPKKGQKGPNPSMGRDGLGWVGLGITTLSGKSPTRRSEPCEVCEKALSHMNDVFGRKHSLLHDGKPSQTAKDIHACHTSASKCPEEALDACVSVVNWLNDAWAGGEMAPYLRASTAFRPSNFSRYWADIQAGVPPPGKGR